MQKHSIDQTQGNISLDVKTKILIGWVWRPKNRGKEKNEIISCIWLNIEIKMHKQIKENALIKLLHFLPWFPKFLIFLLFNSTQSKHSGSFSNWLLSTGVCL